MTTTPGLRVLIVDDEPLARDRIRELLKNDSEVEIVGECGSGRAAVTAIREHAPDLVFLDVQMPGMDGFAVLKTLARERLPLVIFVTAFDQYAVRAFEFYAADYLLKPFKRKRFEQAVRRVKEQMRDADSSDLSRRTLALLEGLEAKSHYLDRLVVKTSGRVFFLRTHEGEWIEAEDNYVRLHLGKESHLLRETLKNLEAQLDPRKFIRVHRCAIVNIDQIKELRPWFNRD